MPWEYKVWVFNPKQESGTLESMLNRLDSMHWEVISVLQGFEPPPKPMKGVSFAQQQPWITETFISIITRRKRI